MRKNSNVKTRKSLFQNNRFVLIFSLVFAVIIWVVVALTVSPEIERTITDVPIVIDMENSTPSKLSLQYFVNDTDAELLTVDVTVVGKRYAVGGLDKENFSVAAVTSAVNSAGYHTLRLQVTPDNDLSSIQLSKDSISVYFDTYSEAEFTIQSEIIADKVIPSDTYLQEKEIITPSTVLISGATKEIEKIEKVVAKVSFNEPLRKTETFTSDLNLVIKEGSDNVNMEFITTGSISSENPIQVTVPVLKKKLLPVSVKFTNVPEYYLNNPLPITATPTTLLVAALESEIDKMNVAYVGTVDFSALDKKNNRFTFSSDDLIDVKAVAGDGRYTVQIDASNMSSKNLSVYNSNVQFQNVASGLTAALSNIEISNITVIGPSATIEALTSDGLYAEIDLKNISAPGTYTVPAKIYAKSVSDCWTHGTYNVSIVVS